MAHPGIHEGKYGFYPCTWETYQKLKVINVAYNRAKHDLAIWQRWERKDPHNRVARPKVKDAEGRVVGYGKDIVLPEPEVSSVFCEATIKKYDKNGRYVKEGLPDYKLKDYRIEEDYRRARYPVQAEEAVEFLSMSMETIDWLYQAILTHAQS